MQVVRVAQVQPAPPIAVMVRPPGALSTSVTKLPAALSPAPELVTTTVYFAPIWLSEKLPTCDLFTVRSGAVMTVAESVAVLLVVLLSNAVVLTVMLLTSGDAALPATLAVMVMLG